MADLSVLQESHLEELQSFNQDWDEKIVQVKNQGIALEESMKEKHKIEKEEFQKNFQASPEQPKPTPELLNLIEMRKKMIKSRRYVEADIAGEKIEELKLKLQTDWNKLRKTKYNTQLVNLTSKQITELESLQIRIRNGVAEKEKIRRKELEMLLQKFQNQSQELEDKQSFDVQKYMKVLQKRNFFVNNRK